MRPHESPAGSVVRAIEEEIDVAVLALGDTGLEPDEAVHGARRALKRARALLRMISDPMERPTHRVLHRNLRAAGHSLAPMREATTLIETFDAHRTLFAEWVSVDVLEATRACIDGRYSEAYPVGRLDGGAVRSAFESLSPARRLLVDWAREHAAFCGEMESFTYIAHGLHRVYKDGREGMRAATLSGDFNEFHHWRKQVKYLRGALQHLEPVAPSEIRPAIDRLSLVNKSLSRAHDLWVLGNFINAHPCPCIDRGLLETYVGITDERRRDLDTRALALAAPIYAEMPRAFTERMEQYWAARR